MIGKKAELMLSNPDEFHRCTPVSGGFLVALESSCDETSVAILDGRKVLAHRIASQDELHRLYGGVVPEIASRRHLEVIHPLLEQTMAEAKVGFADLSAIAVTYGPGLIGAVFVGVAVAKSLSLALDIPVIGVNHVEGHVYSPLLDHPQMQAPWISLVVSGGHTLLAHVPRLGQIEILGRTRDDAAGEAFDKVAKMLELGYPGGPLVSQLATQGDPKAINFPRPMLSEPDGWGFSFSGLKTSVHNRLSKFQDKPADICASFQEAVVDVLVTKAIRAATSLGVPTVSLVGGVAANPRLRERLQQEATAKGLTCLIPSPIFCTDNAAMIGLVGRILLELGVASTLQLDAHACLEFEDWSSYAANPSNSL